MPKLKINDISLYYETHGQGEPIVFIGGFSSDHLIWNEIIDQFKNHYQVILFDNRGAGQTDAPKGKYTIQQMTHDCVTLCAALGIDKAHFVGNSMGGFILQTLAFQYPHLVKSAIISNSAATIECSFHYYVSAQLDLLKAGAPLATIIKASCCWAFSYQFLSQPGMMEELIQFGLNNPYPFTLTGYEGQYAALEGFDSRKWLNQINVPTLVLSGNQDLIFLENSIKFLAEQIPHAKYYCFTDCGHLPFLEYPEKFSAVVKEFISNLNP